MHYVNEDYKELTRPLTQLELNLKDCEVLVDNSLFIFHVLCLEPTLNASSRCLKEGGEEIKLQRSLPCKINPQKPLQ